jgi:lipid A ethanolaminephosphotransferase
MAEANHDELMNAYDNTILYTDYLLDAVIEMLEGLTDRRSCLLFISDHGESLGENNLYMHGVPMVLAPREQIEIPFIVWSSAPSRAVLPPEGAGHYNIFHSVLDFLNIESPIYDPTKTIFAPED